MKKTDDKYQKQVIDVADYIFKNPQCKTAQIIAVFCGKLRKSKRTIESYIKQAKEYNSERIQKQQKAKDEVLIKKAKEAIETAILSRNESLEILSKIARGGAKEIPTESELKDGKKVFIKFDIKHPFDNERIKAIECLAKMEGWNAAQKSEITGRDGKDLFAQMSEKELEAKIVDLEKKYRK